MYWRLISLEEIIQIETLEKKGLCDCKLQHLKIVTNGQQHTKTTEDEEVYLLNKYPYSNSKVI